MDLLGKDILSAEQFDVPVINEIFAESGKMKELAKKRNNKILDGYNMIGLFYEPSTQTRLSFEFAMCQLGARYNL